MCASLPAAEAIVELGHDALADRGAELAKRAGPLGNRDAQQGLAGFTDLGALGDEAQPIEIHVGAAQDRHEVAPRDSGARDPGAEARDRQRARRLHQRTGVVEDVLDRGADFVVRHADDLVDRFLNNREREGADLADRDAVGEDADAIEHDAPPGLERAVHRIGFQRFDADHLDLGPDRLDVTGDAGDQAAAADRHENRRQIVWSLAEDFRRNGALTGDHERIVKGMHEESFPVVGHQLVAARLGVGERIAGQLDLGAELADRVDLDLRRGLRHHDQGADPEVTGRKRHALRVVAGAGRDHAASPILPRQMRHAVVGAAQLVGKDRLQVFAFQQHAVARPSRESPRGIERRRARHVVNTAREYQAQHLLSSHGAIFLNVCPIAQSIAVRSHSMARRCGRRT